jgi:hypothetical protein
MERPSLPRNLVAPTIRRGVCRLMDALGYASTWEFSLGNDRRADVIAVDAKGAIVIVEIKSGREDFLGDRKWREYLDYCDRFFFAVDAGFAVDILPSEAGLIVADAHGGSVLRQAAESSLSPARRRKLILDLALVSCRRLQRLDDPPL